MKFQNQCYMKTKSNLQTTIFNYNTPEFYINMNPANIPSKGSTARKDFIAEEKRKCKEGLNINGIYIPGSLYFHLNYYKLEGDSKTQRGKKEIFLPTLRDNEWIVFNDYEEAVKQGKAYTLFGLRQCGKTEMETSLCLRELSLFKRTEALALFAGDNFKQNFTKKLRIAIEHGEKFIIVPNIDKDWKKEEIRFGITKADNTLDLHSTLFIYNTQEGKKIQVSSGKTPSFFLIDEAAVSPFRAVYETVKPALLSDYGGLRCSPIFTLTGGESQQAKDAENFIKFPVVEEQLVFNYNGKDLGGRFLDGRYRKDCKVDSTISAYTGITTNTWLDDFPIRVTDFQLAEDRINKEKEEASKSPDKSALHLKRIFFPMTLEDVFLSENENPFPRQALEQQLQFLKTNPYGQNIELFRSLSGKVEFKFSNKLPINEYPTKSYSLDAPIVMYDSPEKFRGQKGLHVVACLPTGEKVLTSKGLLNIEDVSIEDKLINKDGELVDIFNLQKTFVEKEDIYSIKTSNVFRKSLFTSEHPILTSDNVIKRMCPRKAKKLGVRQREKVFDFKFKTAQNLKEKDWVVIPNTYKNLKNDFNIEELWKDEKLYKECYQIDNPLLKEDFWWLVGLWAGDGFASKRTTSVNFCFNSNELESIEKFKTVCKNILQREPTICKIRENCKEYTVSSRQFNTFLNDNFGTGAGGKKIPEWVKKLDDNLKKHLLLGYLHSDGCVTVDERNYSNIQYVSVSLELLEGIQDIAFSLNLLPNLSLLRETGFREIKKGKISTTKACYTLRFCNDDTIKFCKMFNNYKQDYKLKKVVFKETNRRAFKNAMFSEDFNHIYLQIKKIETFKYSGWVHNFECETHTYITRCCTTHNCDTYSDSEAPTSDSLGSVYVFRRNHSDLSDPFNGCMVASYTARPKTMREFNETILLLAEFYDAQIMYEHVHDGFLQFFDGKNKGHLLIDTPSLQKEINPNSKVGNSKGLRPTVGNKKHALNLSLDYLNEELPDGKLGVTRILDPVLIEELLAYDGVKNTDRYIAFSMGMEAIYMYKKFLVVVNYESEEETQDRKKQYVSKKNAFGFDINKKTNIFGL